MNFHSALEQENGNGFSPNLRKLILHVKVSDNEIFIFLNWSMWMMAVKGKIFFFINVMDVDVKNYMMIKGKKFYEKYIFFFFAFFKFIK